MATKEVRMLINISGPRADGEVWPQRGEKVCLPEAEANALIAAGSAASTDGEGEPLSGDAKRAADEHQAATEHDANEEDADAKRAVANEAAAVAAETRAAGDAATEQAAGDTAETAAAAKEADDAATKAEDQLDRDDKAAAAEEYRPAVPAADPTPPRNPPLWRAAGA